MTKPIRRKKRRKDPGKIARVEDVPELAWRAALRGASTFVLHHVRCAVMGARDCDCYPLIVGAMWMADHPRPSA